MGMSMNYYDSLTEKWRQVWIASNYSIDIGGGLNEVGAMVLEGQLHSTPRRTLVECLLTMNHTVNQEAGKGSPFDPLFSAEFTMDVEFEIEGPY